MAELDPTVEVTTETTEVETVETETSDNAELARLRAELAKQKAAIDKATKEASEYKKALRQKQSAEEIAAEEKRISDEARDKELADLRKRFAVAETSKKVMGFMGNEEEANNVAESLYGAEDIEAVVAAIQKAWLAREKALRLEYGKIPAPGVGGSDGPTITRAQLDAMKFTERVAFANEHPDEYNKLMGR